MRERALDPFPIALGLLVITIGAVLRYAVTAHLAGFDLQAAGAILIGVGVAGMVIALGWPFLLAQAHRPPPAP